MTNGASRNASATTRCSFPMLPRTIRNWPLPSSWKTEATAPRRPHRLRAKCTTISCLARCRQNARNWTPGMNMAINILFNLAARRLDGPLMAAIVILVAVGVGVIYSASGGQTFDRALGQLRNFAVALAIMWIVANIQPQQLMRLALPIYVVGLILLVCVALFGEIRNGARRWLSLGVTTIQPSEIMKIGVPLALAWYFHKREEGLRARDYALAALLPVLPTMLVMRQPDLGTALLI